MIRVYNRSEREVETIRDMNLKKHEYSLLDLIEDLHMNCTGSSDSFTKEDMLAARDEIKTRLFTWSAPSSAYDEAVFTLGRKVLVEADRELAQYKEEK